MNTQQVFRTSFTLSIFFFLSLNIIVAQATEVQLDSMNNILAHSKDENKKSETYLHLGTEIVYEQPELARKYFLECRRLAIKNNLHELHSLSYSRMTHIYLMELKVDSSSLVNEKAFEIAKAHNLGEASSIALTNIATAQQNKGAYLEAISTYKQALTYPAAAGNKMILLNNMGNTYREIADYEAALEVFTEALEISRVIEHQIGEGIILGNIGDVQLDLERPSAALVSYRKALEVRDELGREQDKISVYKGIGDAYILLDSLGAAQDAIEKSISIAEFYNDTTRQIWSLLSLARIEFELSNLNQTESHLNELLNLSNQVSYPLVEDETDAFNLFAMLYNARKNYEKAREYADRALESYKKHENAEFFDITPTLKDKAVALKGLDLYSESTEVLEQALAIKEKQIETERAERITELETRFRVAEKENDLKILEIQKNAEIEAEQARRTLFIWLLVAAAILVLGLIYFMRQLQKQKKLIEAQRGELKTLDQFKSRFFANVSHELRTPLTLMLSPIASALKRNRLENQDFTFLKLAQQSGRDLLRLINEILDLSKLEASKLELEEVPTVLYLLLRRTASSFESLAERQNTQFQFDYHAEQEMQVLLDADKFQKIVNNLLSNAFKFTSKNGMVHLALSDKGEQLLLQVTDSGNGILAEDLPRVFDRFYQSKNPDEAAQGGTGIGLALCKEFSKLFNGKLWVESTVGKGSTFYFEFPKKEVLQSLPTDAAIALKELKSPKETIPSSVSEKNIPPPASTKPTSEKTILLVEDNHSLRDYLQLILEEHYQVITAENGEEAIERLTVEGGRQTAINGQPSLIISDVMMPIMDGFQLLEKLKASDDWRHIPVVMLTARAELGDKLKALRIGVDDYITKPFEEEELLTRISNLLDNMEERANWVKNILPESTDSRKVKDRPVLSQEDAEWLTELEASVKDNMNKVGFNVETLSDTLFLSRRQLQRRIKQLTGLSPNQYIQEARLQEARHLLESRTKSSVKSVCAAIGVKDAKHFSSQFKQRFGKLPSTYF